MEKLLGKSLGETEEGHIEANIAHESGKFIPVLAGSKFVTKPL